MNCHEFDQQLLDYLYDELAADRREEADLHLARCQTCHEKLGAMRVVQEQLDRVKQHAEKPSRKASAGAVVAKTRLRRSSQRRRRRRWLGGIIAATLCVGMLQFLSVRVAATANGISITWGRPISSASENRAGEMRDRLGAQAQRIDEMDALLRLVVDVMQTDDRERSQDSLAIHRQLRELERTGDARWRAVNQLIRGLPNRPFPVAFHTGEAEQ